MAIETPFHIERLRFLRQGHFIDAPVAGGATDALGDMNAVIEIDVAWQIVDAIPFQRSACRKTFTNRSQHRGFTEDLRMARHAGLSGWQSCKRRFFN